MARKSRRLKQGQNTSGILDDAKKPGVGPAQKGLVRNPDAPSNVAAKPLPPNTAVDIENHPSSNDAVNAVGYEPLPLNPVGTLSAETTAELDVMATDKAVDLAAEFIPGQIAANSYYGPLLQNYLRSLPRPTDDVERDYGIDVYEKMLNDPVVSAAVQALKVQAPSSGVRFVGRISRPTPWDEDPNAAQDYAKSEEILAFVKTCMAHLQQPISAIVADMLDCIAYGHSLAEQIYERRDGQIVLKALRVKNRYRFAYVCDRFLSLLGVVPTEKAAGIIPVEWVLPRRKFWHQTIFTHQSDPRGRSLLRPAYNAWYQKQEAWIHYLKYLVQFATPSLLALLDDMAKTVQEVDQHGNPVMGIGGRPKTISPEEHITRVLSQFQNSSAMAMRFVRDVKILQADGNGDPYIKAIELYNSEMFTAIIMNPRALSEAKHGSKADSDTAQDILTTFVFYIQCQVQECFYRDVILPLVALNYNIADADAFAPLMMLSVNNKLNTIELGTMIGVLAQAGFLDPSQYPGIDAMIGLPERDLAAMQARMEQEYANAVAAKNTYASTMTPQPEDNAPVDLADDGGSGDSGGANIKST